MGRSGVSIRGRLRKREVGLADAAPWAMNYRPPSTHFISANQIAGEPTALFVKPVGDVARPF